MSRPPLGLDIDAGRNKDALERGDHRAAANRSGLGALGGDARVVISGEPGNDSALVRRKGLSCYR